MIYSLPGAPPALLHLAMYKGPAKGWFRQKWHQLVCWVTSSEYSHCELVLALQGRIPGGVLGGAILNYSVCVSSSNRDGGVRRTTIDLASGRWDVYALPAVDEQERIDVENWFFLHDGQGYDYLGLLYFLIPARLGGSRTWFCSEACAAAIGMPEPWKVSPQDLLDYLQERP